MLLTFIFIGIILAFAVYSRFSIRKNVKRNTFTENINAISNYPSILTTLGVLGTFVGIVLGLSDFNTTDIDNSIVKLLDGLKIAFWTSIVGMVSSMELNRHINKHLDKQEGESLNTSENYLKSLNSQFKSAVEYQQIISSSLTNLVELNQEMLKSNKNETTRQEEISRSIQLIRIASQETTKGIAGLQNTNNECLDAITNQAGIMQETLEQTTGLSTTIKSEIYDITSTLQDNNQLMVSKFDEFSDLMRQNNVDALVHVMKQVTEEFNKQMSELINRLVQENFEELNKSVERLNTWQQENKTMISELTTQYKQMNTSFKSTSTVLSEVAQNTDSLTNNNSSLQKLIQELQRVLIDDTKFEKITTSLNNTVEHIEQSTNSFDESTKHLNTWIMNHKDLSDGVRLLVSKLDEINKLKDYNSSFWDETRKYMNEGVSIIASASQELNTSIDGINSEFYTRLNDTLTNLDNCIQAMHENKRRLS